MQYTENIFSRIIRKEISAEILLEDTYSICLKDKEPKSKIHYLVIPKGSYVDFLDFKKNSKLEEQISFWDLVAQAVENLNLSNGYRLIANSGKHANQEIKHFHLHILGGQPLE